MDATEFIEFTKYHNNWGRLIARDSNPTSINIRKFLKEATSFLDDNVKMTQRAWHVINNLYEIPVCNYCKINKVKFNNNEMNYRKYCSIKCSTSAPECKEKFIATNIEKYGVPYPAMDKDIYEKTISTNLKKYGVKYSSQAESVKNKQKENNLKKYGVVSTSQCPEIKEKQKNKNLEKYGYEFANSTILNEYAGAARTPRPLGTGCVAEMPETNW